MIKTNNNYFPFWNPSIHFFKILDKKIRIGTDDNGGLEINHDIEIWYYVFKKCNGKNKLSEILNNVFEKFKAEKIIILNGLVSLKEKNFLFFLDKCIDKYEWFNKNINNILYFSSNGYDGIEIQKKLNKTSVAILGLGGGGFSIFQNLVCLGIEKIIVVDYDKIEEKNLNRQIYWSKKDVGKFKVDLAQEYALSKNPSISVNKIIKKIQKVQDVEEVIEDVDWVFSCMDEPPYKLQRIVNKACYNKNKKVLFCFCQKNNGRFFMLDPKKTGCVDCLFQEVMNEGTFDFISSLYQSNFKSSTAVIISTISLLCSIIVNEWLENLIKLDKNKFNKIQKVEFQNLSVKLVKEWKKKINCVTCGNLENKDKILNKFYKLVSI